MLMCTVGFAQKNGASDLFAGTMSRLEADGPSVVCGSVTMTDGDNTGIQDFELSLSGSKFFLVLEDGETMAWFDSKTLWSGYDYGDGIEEIYISNPTPDEVAIVNPSELLRRSGDFSISQKGTDTFIMEPRVQGETVMGVSKVTVRVDLQTMRPVGIDMDVNDSRVSIRISGWKPNCKFQNSMFTCPLDRYPDAEIVDLR